MKFLSSLMAALLLGISTYLVLTPAWAEEGIYFNDNAIEFEADSIVLDQNDSGTNMSLQFGNTLAEALWWDNAAQVFKFTDDLNLEGHELQNFRIENLASAPTCDAGATGRTYFNTGDDQTYICDGTSFTILGGGGSSTTLTDADADTSVTVEQAADQDAVRVSTAGTEQLVIDATGAASATGVWTFGQDIQVVGDLLDSSGSAGTVNQVLIADGAGGQQWDNLLLDQDDFASDSATRGATQQSIGAYINGLDLTNVAQVNALISTSETNLIGTAPVSADTLGELYTTIQGIVGGVVLQTTTWDASTGSFPSGANEGFWYFTDTAGTVDGITVAPGDSIIALVDSASTTTYASNWYHIPKSIPTPAANQTAYYQTTNLTQTTLNNLTAQTVSWNTTPTHNSNTTVFQPHADGVQVLADGDYEIAASLYQNATSNRTNLGLQIAVNGTPQGVIGAGGYIRNGSGHNESSGFVSQILTLTSGDIISIQAQRLAAAGTITTPGGSGNLVVRAAINSFSSGAQTTLVTQASHGFSLTNGVPLPAYVDGTGTVQLAQANSSSTLTGFYITDIIDANNFRIHLSGIIDVSSHGLTIGEYYFLSDTTAGAVTTTSPTMSDTCFYVLNANQIILKDNRPFDI